MVGAVYGFTSILLKAINDLKPTNYAVAFDRKAPTFRHLMYADYKATRPETPAELAGQFGRVRELVRAFDIPIFEMDGFEADDILGTLKQTGGRAGHGYRHRDRRRRHDAAGDRQDQSVLPKPRGTFGDADLYDAAAVLVKYEIGPEHIADYKALKGDPSDNIPGVKASGKKRP